MKNNSALYIITSILLLFIVFGSCNNSVAASELKASAVLYLDQNIVTDEPHMPSLFAAAQARIRGQFEIDRSLLLLDRYLSLGEDQSNRTKSAVWWLKGQANELLNDEAKAIECYEKSLLLYPEFDRAKKSLKKLKEKK